MSSREVQEDIRFDPETPEKERIFSWLENGHIDPTPKPSLFYESVGLRKPPECVVEKIPRISKGQAKKSLSSITIPVTANENKRLQRPPLRVSASKAQAKHVNPPEKNVKMVQPRRMTIKKERDLKIFLQNLISSESKISIDFNQIKEIINHSTPILIDSDQDYVAIMYRKPVLNGSEVNGVNETPEGMANGKPELVDGSEFINEGKSKIRALVDWLLGN